MVGLVTVRGARLQFGGSPWARQAFAQDREEALRLYEEARRLQVSVHVVGKQEFGPWVVRIGTAGRTLRFMGRDLHEAVRFGLERWSLGANDDHIRWAAGPDGIAHGHAAVRAALTLCKLSPIGEQFRHPETGRCRDCWRALDRRTVAA